jgi:hypothetical protein
MNPIRELPSGKGFCSVFYLPRRNIENPALVVELKWNIICLKEWYHMIDIYTEKTIT